MLNVRFPGPLTGTGRSAFDVVDGSPHPCGSDCRLSRRKSHHGTSCDSRVGHREVGIPGPRDRCDRDRGRAAEALSRARSDILRGSAALPNRHGSLQHVALLGSRTDRTWTRRAADAGAIREALRQAGAADAEAICEAVTRPTMRFVPVKTPDQQSVMMLHRVRLMLNRQRMVW